jgi:6-phosphofructokinase 2
VEAVVVTMSKEGAIAVTPDAEYRVQVPDLDVVSAVGAGDAFLSGLLYGLVKEQSWEAGLALGAAASAAVCLTPGTVLCTGADVWRLRPLVTVERIRERAAAG